MCFKFIQKVLGCSYDVHATTVLVSMSCLASHYCSSLCSYIGVGLVIIFSGSVHSTFHHYENQQGGVEFLEDYYFEFFGLCDSSMQCFQQQCFTIKFWQVIKSIGNCLYYWGSPEESQWPATPKIQMKNIPRKKSRK